MSNFLSDRFDALAAAIDRRIDNELNAEYQPAPSHTADAGIVTKDDPSEIGRAKLAGTGGRIVPMIPNSVIYAGVAAAFGFVVWKVVR